jgi:uncharacterized protein
MMKSKINYSLLVFCAIVLFSSCNQEKKEKIFIDTVAYKKEVDQWYANRIEELKAPNGWLNLIGLLWLKDGINTFGSDSKNDVVFPDGKIIAKAGYFLVKENTVSMEAIAEANITFQGAPVKTLILFHPDSTRAPIVEYQSLRWNVIKRDDKFGIRLRDLSHPDVQSFKGIERYTVNVDWRCHAKFAESKSDKTIEITNVLGQTTAQKSPGTLAFKIGNKEYELDVLEGNKEEFFVIFGDATNAKETYGAGRFIYVRRPDSNGDTIIDFNKAYNPPCAFTEFATCPLPPKQNVLPVEIKAGEKNYGDYEHFKKSVNE